MDSEALSVTDWMEVIGPAAPDYGGRVAAYLGMTGDQLMAAVARGDVLALPIFGSEKIRIIPMSQFSEEKLLLPHLALVLEALRQHTDDPYAMAVWLNRASPVLDGLTPTEALRAGRWSEVLASAKEGVDIPRQ